MRHNGRGTNSGEVLYTHFDIVVCLGFVNLGPGCLTSQTSDRPVKALFHPLTGRAGQIDQAQRPRIIRHRFVGVELNLLSATVPFEEKAASGQLFLLNLFDDTTFRVILIAARCARTRVLHGLAA